MKQNKIINAVAGFFKAFERRPRTLEATRPNHEPTEEDRRLQQALLQIEAEENSGAPYYRHWGLND